jgi:SulP family sulfate permease
VGDQAAGQRIYRITGQVFFASADMLVEAFDVREIDGAPVRIDVSRRISGTSPPLPR